MQRMRTIDAEAFCAFLRDVSTRQHYETLLTNKDKYPTVADVIEAICCDLDGTSLNGFDNAPTVEVPENVVNCVLTMFGDCYYNITGCSDCEVINKIGKALEKSIVVTDRYYEAFNGRPIGEWILVSERLPKEDNDYLITYKSYRESVVAKSWFNTRYGFILDNVIAWMPLPQPYKEAEND